MKSLKIRVSEPQKVDYEDIILPLISSRELLCETRATAVSIGTEVSAVRGDPPLRDGVTYPRTLGYCNLAQVFESDVSSHFQKGDWILSHAAHMTTFVLKESDVLISWKQSESPSPEMAGLYLGHLGHQALVDLKARAGERLAVVGLGPIGLLLGPLGKIFGMEVDGYARSSQKAERCKQMGFTRFVCEKDVRKECEGHADLVVLTANTWTAWNLAARLVRKGGRIAVIGFPGRGESQPVENPLDPILFYQKSITVKWIGFSVETEVPFQVSDFTIPRSLRLLKQWTEEGKIPLGTLLDCRIGWRSLPKKLLELVENRSQVNGVLVDWTKDE